MTGKRINDEPVFPSTRWESRLVKIRRPPEAQKRSTPEGRSFHSLPARDRRRPLNLTISYRGGPESWWEIHARGVIYRRPGWYSLEDVMRDLNHDL